MSTIHSDSIPNFITAATPMGLRRVMLLTNAKKGAQLQYFDIKQVQLNGKFVFIAWYFDRVDNEQIKELEASK